MEQQQKKTRKLTRCLSLRQAYIHYIYIPILINNKKQTKPEENNK